MDAYLPPRVTACTLLHNTLFPGQRTRDGITLTMPEEDGLQTYDLGCPSQGY
jgi:hypothetical protein